jgi:hypothetical protein
MDLIECLSGIEDPRRLQGQRYSNTAILLIIIMSILHGQYGYREIGRFCELNKSILIDTFGFRNNKVPSYASIRTFIMTTNFISIQGAFHSCAQHYVPIDKSERAEITTR